MCRATTRFPSKEPRNGNQEIQSSQCPRLAPQKAWIPMIYLLFASISHWILCPYYSALSSLPMLRSFPFGGGTDITSGAILAILQVIQPQSPPNVPSNGNALWYQNEAFNWVREYLPIGNGYLGGESFRSIPIPSSFTEMAPFGSHGIRWCDFRSIITQYRFSMEWRTISE